MLMASPKTPTPYSKNMDTDTIVFIPLQETKITRKELLQNITDNKGKAYFMIKHDWYNIHASRLHDKIDEIIDDGYLLMNVNFKPMSVDGDDIIFLVCVNDTSEFVIGDSLPRPENDDDL